MERNANGTFAKGNKGGPGNPYARKVALIRNQIIEAVSEDDLREIVQALIKKAKSGDIFSCIGFKPYKPTSILNAT